MKTFQSEDGLSEVIGFILLIGLLVVFLAVYQTYTVPVQGRDTEIDHMNEIKNTFTAYKISLDSLWVNEREGTMLSTTLDMGTGGGYSQGGFGNIGFLTPISSGGSVGVNQRNETITVTVGSNIDGVRTLADFNPGALEYQSNNYYWIDQNYYYQLGGVFLEQNSGSTVRVMPPLTIARYGTDEGYTAKVDFTIIRLNGGELISGTGPVRVETNLNNGGIIESPDYVGITNVTITVGSDNPKTLLMWKNLFEDSLARYGIPSEWYDPLTISDEKVSLNVIGAQVNGTSLGVYANIIRTNYTTTLQTVATDIQ
ncbi:hypothetical protein [Methanogenium organophilum]|uniref:Uncharacterized protein n=1 Tax=Methanogenium organophilum TaxID=2199 RepID=A0A9X9S4F3_METOG|nr:hypothetical protein [Methanogenium organophilum]WAI01290.1 hypothetical protein OU421_12910 [Methanogenium organophilum]